MYAYISPVGKMLIFFDKNANGFALSINGIIYGLYSPAVAAADDVYVHVTGCDEWDSLDGEIHDAPTDIYEWEII